MPTSSPRLHRALAQNSRARLVWPQAGENARDRLRYRALVTPRHTARLARPLQPYLVVGLRSAEHDQHPIRRSLVSQDPPHLLRRDRLRALALRVGDIFQHAPPDRKHQKIPPDRIVRMTEAICFAA